MIIPVLMRTLGFHKLIKCERPYVGERILDGVAEWAVDSITIPVDADEHVTAYVSSPGNFADAYSMVHKLGWIYNEES